ncbi:MAG TPA: LPS export ABC transporter permease LptG [Macromonas sp.]|nr:LPS export ABC transporter permease LptG [Macromonas sp.]
MKTIRRLIYGEILWAVLFVLAAFLALFMFFDLVDELSMIGRASVLDSKKLYTLGHAGLYVLLYVPSHIYELLPIAVLIGTVFVLARLAQSSEYTILRTSGLGPWRALRTLLALGAVFVLLTFVIGDYVAPTAERTAQLLKAQFKGSISVGQTGAWLKERQDGHAYSVNVQSMNAQGRLEDIRIFDFDERGLLTSEIRAKEGRLQDEAGWMLSEVERRSYVIDAQNGARVSHETLPTLLWPSTISAEMVSTALLKPDRMRTLDLFAYIQHLQANNQSAQRYEIEFWRKVFYPMSCLVMVVLALPFAYLHFRARGLSAYVFMGVMIGISFFLLNNVFGYIGNLRDWAPWLAAAAPALIYSLISLGAFGWLVLKR